MMRRWSRIYRQRREYTRQTTSVLLGSRSSPPSSEKRRNHENGTKTCGSCHPPPSEAFGTLKAPDVPQYMLAVGLQRKTRSWDFMPAQVTRPYATSAICHLVEMVVMLGDVLEGI